MASVTFDTHGFVKLMRESGLTEPQAEAIVHMQTSVLDSQLATQAGLDALRMTLQADLEQLKISVQADLEQQKITTRADLRELELRLQTQIKDQTIRLGGMMMALGGILIAIRYFG